MEWRDEGLIIGVRRHGENSAIVELMTRAHGRHMGIVKGGRSRRMQPVLQPGNTLGVVWRARLEEHLGVYAVEPMRQRAAALMESGLALAGVNLMGAWLRLLPERDPHEGLFEMVEALADHLADARLAPALMARFELAVLSELGFGLDLDQCAATGAREDLVWVSPAHGPRRQPRGGRALGRKAPAAARLPARRLSPRGRQPRRTSKTPTGSSAISSNATCWARAACRSRRRAGRGWRGWGEWKAISRLRPCSGAQFLPQELAVGVAWHRLWLDDSADGRCGTSRSRCRAPRPHRLIAGTTAQISSRPGLADDAEYSRFADVRLARQ